MKNVMIQIVPSDKRKSFGAVWVSWVDFAREGSAALPNLRDKVMIANQYYFVRDIVEAY
jgi:hypothetical protein